MDQTPPPPEEEIVLLRSAQAGDMPAKKRIIEANVLVVIDIAKTYRKSSISLENLVQEGALGLIQAAERFDPEHGFRLPIRHLLNPQSDRSGCGQEIVGWTRGLCTI